MPKISSEPTKLTHVPLVRSSFNKRLLTIGVITWLFATAIISIVSGYRLGLPKYLRLMSHGLETQGKVIELQDENRLITYEFKTDAGKTMVGTFWGDKGYTFLGRSLTITYDPTLPEDHLLGDIRAGFRGELVTWIVISIIPTIVCLGSAIMLSGVFVQRET